jgi:hypothetical protein
MILLIRTLTISEYELESGTAALSVNLIFIIYSPESLDRGLIIIEFFPILQNVDASPRLFYTVT